MNQKELQSARNTTGRETSHFAVLSPSHFVLLSDRSAIATQQLTEAQERLPWSLAPVPAFPLKHRTKYIAGHHAKARLFRPSALGDSFEGIQRSPNTSLWKRNGWASVAATYLYHVHDPKPPHGVLLLVFTPTTIHRRCLVFLFRPAANLLGIRKLWELFL